MSEVKFPEGIRAFKPHENAPAFVIAAIEINTADLMTWLNSKGDKVRLDLKESKSGTYYCSVNDFVPKPQGDNRTHDTPPKDGFDEDSIPF